IDETRLVLEGLEEAAHGRDVGEIWMVEHVDGTTDVEVAVAQEGADLVEEAAVACPERIEWIVRALDVVEDGLEGLAAVPPGQGAADLAQLLQARARHRRDGPCGDPARLRHHHRERAALAAG